MPDGVLWPVRCFDVSLSLSVFGCVFGSVSARFRRVSASSFCECVCVRVCGVCVRETVQGLLNTPSAVLVRCWALRLTAHARQTKALCPSACSQKAGCSSQDVRGKQKLKHGLKECLHKIGDRLPMVGLFPLSMFGTQSVQRDRLFFF